VLLPLLQRDMLFGRHHCQAYFWRKKTLILELDHERSSNDLNITIPVKETPHPRPKFKALNLLDISLIIFNNGTFQLTLEFNNKHSILKNPYYSSNSI
jgi:hypothetical protein